ncbi:hypothetical protein NHQ30_002442 [Ciborinia camelliae]|nr:hypothetical protein NHQ30_002442 [Ciborinia camelliae]
MTDKMADNNILEKDSEITDEKGCLNDLGLRGHQELSIDIIYQLELACLDLARLMNNTALVLERTLEKDSSHPPEEVQRDVGTDCEERYEEANTSLCRSQEEVQRDVETASEEDRKNEGANIMNIMLRE